jgi:hypothetical protein
VDLEVRDAPDDERYEARAGDELAGFAAYTPARGEQGDGLVLVFTHTEVDPAFEGQGVGGTLVRGALDDVRRRGASLVARCSFVHTFVERHPEYQDLVYRPPGAASR